MTLLCTFWGDDAGGRVFDVLVDGEKIASQSLERNQPGEFFEAGLRGASPADAGKNPGDGEVPGQPDRMAGGLFGLRVLKPAAGGRP